MEVPFDFQGKSGTTVVGYLEAEPNKFITRLISGIKDRLSDHEIALYHVDIGYPHRQNAYIFLGVVGIFFLLGIWGLCKWRRMSRTVNAP